MNQEKIGMFIRELRTEKKLTQQELADKLGVSDKAISKWENGRCLMDLSLLKPLSDVLGISIVELINGEKIDDENLYDKSTEAINNTLDYSKKEIKKNKYKTIYLMICCCFVILFGFYLIRQSYYWMLYPNFNKQYYIDVSNGLNFRKTNKIYKKTLYENEYISFGNIKIKNVFSDYFISDESSDFDIPNYFHTIYLKNSENKNKFVFIRNLDKVNTPYNIINKYGEIVSFTYDDMKDFYLKNDIDDEIDFMKYASKNQYKLSNFFISPKKMKFNMAYNNYVVDYCAINYDYIELIEGDYRGYIRKLGGKDLIELVLLKDNTKYTFMFFDELADYNFIIDLISTIEIR